MSYCCGIGHLHHLIHSILIAHWYAHPLSLSLHQLASVSIPPVIIIICFIIAPAGTHLCSIPPLIVIIIINIVPPWHWPCHLIVIVVLAWPSLSHASHCCCCLLNTSLDRFMAIEEILGYGGDLWAAKSLVILSAVTNLTTNLTSECDLLGVLHPHWATFTIRFVEVGGDTHL